MFGLKEELERSVVISKSDKEQVTKQDMFHIRPSRPEDDRRARVILIGRVNNIRLETKLPL